MFSKNYLPILFGVLCGVILIFIANTVMYNYHLIKFFNIDEYKYSEHGISFNGEFNKKYGAVISSLDLLADDPAPGGRSVAELCPNVSSSRGHTTLSFVGDYGVCCWTEENQFELPYKDTDIHRHYLCGTWPHLDEVTVPIDKVKINFHKKGILNDIPTQNSTL